MAQLKCRECGKEFAELVEFRRHWGMEHQRVTPVVWKGEPPGTDDFGSPIGDRFIVGKLARRRFLMSEESWKLYGDSAGVWYSRRKNGKWKDMAAEED